MDEKKPGGRPAAPAEYREKQIVNRIAMHPAADHALWTLKQRLDIAYDREEATKVFSASKRLACELAILYFKSECDKQPDLLVDVLEGFLEEFYGEEKEAAQIQGQEGSDRGDGALEEGRGG